MTDIAARLRILGELHEAAMHAWPDLPAHEHTTAMLMLALDRLAACEPRGYARRRPGKPVTLDATRLAPGLE